MLVDLPVEVSVNHVAAVLVEQKGVLKQIS